MQERIEYGNHIAIWKEVVDNINRIVDILTEAVLWQGKIRHTIAGLENIQIDSEKGFVKVDYWDGNEDGYRDFIEFPMMYLNMSSEGIKKDFEYCKEQAEKERLEKKEKEEKEKRYKEYLKLKEEFE